MLSNDQTTVQSKKWH